MSKPLLAACWLWIASNTAVAQVAALPDEPIAIGARPQFFVDDTVVDNRFALRYKREAVVRRFHAPKKHSGNPLIRNDGGYTSVVRDAKTGRFRMWYQTSHLKRDKAGKHAGSEYAIAYAESKDGVHWKRPKLGLFEWNGTKQNNVVWRGITGRRASGPCLLELPPGDRRGYRYVMSYRTSGRGKTGIRVVGSQDGIHWDAKSDTLIAAIPSDTLNSIVYDPARKRYLMYCRAKHIYRTFKGPIRDTGASRRVALMTGERLWSEWKSQPRNILIPDELDSARRFNFFYGMAVHRHAGIFWGALWTFRMNDLIVPELAFSRDGVNFQRLPTRPAMIPLGKDGAWDDAMIFPGARWVEVGDEWWIYYAGWDGPHGQPESRKPGIGLATMKKERFFSLRGPLGGGVVITRTLRWPGGKLLLNAAAKEGEVQVRVSDARRKVIPGFDYGDCLPFRGDSTAAEIHWKKNAIAALAGRTIRLEIFLRNADLFTFRATGAAKARALKIVAFGDSTTAPRKTVKAVYAARLPGLLKAKGIAATVINAGVGGSHTGRLKDNARHKVRHALDRLDAAVRSRKPDVVVVQFGINDSWVDSGKPGGRSRIPLDDYRSNLARIVRTLKADGARVLVTTPNKIGGRHPEWRVKLLSRYAEAAREVARKQRVELVDVWRAYERYEKSTGRNRATLMLDGVHPSDDGHALAAKLLAEAIAAESRRSHKAR